MSGQVTRDPEVINDLPQVWQQASGTWRDLSYARFRMHLYPFMFLAPNGRVFNAGPNQDTRYLDTSGLGAWTVVAHSNFGIRTDGSSVMYDEGKVLIVGGDGDGPALLTNTAEVIDLDASPSPSWRYVSPMAYARKYHTATLLPDGKVLVTNGTSSPAFNDETGAVHVAEMWDPETELWSTMAGMRFPRVYHSTAVLLLDGRVLVSGGGQPAPRGEVDRKDFDIYSPPYLFKGARPTISSAPTTVTYDETFFVQTPDATRITDVNWIRLPAVTHAFDQNQRLNKLSFSQASGGLSVMAPSSANASPPGHYMLFILDEEGVPSVAHIVRITAIPGER